MRRLWLIAPLALVASYALAQPATVTVVVPDGLGGVRPPRCADFERLASGAWMPRLPISINGVVLGPGVAVSPGVGMGGVDLAATLNHQCFG